MPGFVHIVDDDAPFATAIQRRLKMAVNEVATYPLGAAFRWNSLASENELGCILLDVRIPGLSGPELQDRLSELGWTLPIVFLTGYADVQTTVRAIKAGAEGFLDQARIIGRSASRGRTGPVARHEVARSRKSQAGYGSCLYREIDAARVGGLRKAIVRGKTNKQAANALGCTERTIKAHRHRVMEKMQARSTVELVSLAERVAVLGDASGSRPTA